MKCLRCNGDLKHYPFNIDLRIYGAESKPHPYSPIIQTPHNPHSVYICENCGYVEFSTKDCDTPDI